jgi:predicted lipoprotein with Yx(FWY)xxD motif
MAARTGHEGTLMVARAAGAMLAAAALSAGALFASTLASSSPASAVRSSGRSLTIITAHVGKVGTVLATRSGLTLYRYTLDPAGKATCSATCAKVWPPLLLPKGVTHIRAPHDVTGLTAVGVHGGRLQVFFHGHALYRFVSDAKKGEATGQGVENDWFAVLSNGKSSASQPASTSTTTGGGVGAGAGGPATTTTSPVTTKTPGDGTSSPPATAPVTKSPPTSTPQTTVPRTTVPPTTTTPTTSPPTTTTTSASTGGAGF